MIATSRLGRRLLVGFVVPTLLVTVLECTVCAQDAPGASLKLALPAPTAREQTDENRDRVAAAQFSPTGRYLVLGLESGHLATWDLSTGQFAWSRPAHEQALKLLAFGAEDRYVLSGASDLQVMLWDLEAGRSLLSFEGAPLKQIYDIALSTNARFALSRGFDGFGVVWDLRVNRKLQDLFSYGFDWGPRDAFFVTTPRRQPGAQLVRVLDGDTPRQILEGQSVGCVAVDPTGEMVACSITSDESGKVVLVNVADGAVRGEFEIPAGSDGAQVGGTALEFSSDGRALLIGCSDGRVIVVDTSSQEVLATYRVSREDPVSQVAFVGSRDGHVLAASHDMDAGCHTACWKAGQPRPVWEKSGPVTIDGRRMLAALTTEEGALTLFGATDGKPVRQLRAFLYGEKWLDVR